jgi:hypothetical protein
MASLDLGIHESKIYRFVEHLKNAGNLNIKPNNKFSVISIINWDTYQGEEEENEQQLKQQVNNNRTTSEQQNSKSLQTLGGCENSVINDNSLKSNTNKNNKNNKNIKNKEYSEDFLKFYQDYPNKIDKKRAFICWEKNKNKPDIEIILAAIEKQKIWRDTANGEWRPEWKHPATWINNDCWEDELETSSRKSNPDDEFLMVRP